MPLASLRLCHRPTMTAAMAKPSSTAMLMDPRTEGAAAGRMTSNGLPPPVIPICWLFWPAVATAEVELELEIELVSVLFVLVCSVVVVTFVDVDIDFVVVVFGELELELSSVVVVDASAVLALDTTVSLILVVAAAVVVSVPVPGSNPHKNVLASPTKKCPINVPPLAFCPAHALCTVPVRSLS